MTPFLAVPTVFVEQYAFHPCGKNLTKLQYIHAFCVVTYSFVTVYLLWSAPRKSQNLAFASLTLCSVLWSASLLFVHDPAISEQRAALGYNLGAPGWCSFGSVSLWFVLAFAGERRALARRSVQLALVIPPVMLTIAQWRGLLSDSYVACSWGWGFRWSRSPWVLFYSGYYMLYMGLGFVYLAKVIRSTPYPLVRRQGIIIASAAVIPFILALLTDMVLPMLEIRTAPNIGPAFLLIWVVGSAFAIVRYSLGDFTPEAVADELVEAMNDGLLLLDREGRIMSANPAAERLIGNSTNSLRLQSFAALFGEQGAGLGDNEHSFESSSGETVIVSVSRSSVSHPQAGDLGTLCMLRDVTAYKATQLELLRAHDALEDRVTARTKDLHEALDKIRRSSRFAETLHTCSRTVHLAIQDKRSTAEIGVLVANVLERALDLFTGVRLTIDGAVLESDVLVESEQVIEAPIIAGGKQRGQLVAFVAHQEDLTEERRVIETVASEVGNAIGALSLQSALLQSERLAAVGLLAAGVAHEINNPLAYVTQGVQELAEATVLSEVQTERMEEVLEGCRRMRRIVAELGDFSRVRDEVSVFPLQDPLRAAVAMAANEIRHRAQLQLRLGAKHLVEADSGRLSQVFLNLLTNAAHAIEEGDTETNAVIVETWDEAEHTCVAVQDTGPGIMDAHVARLFEPFFSTKANGAGLGLAICRDIMLAAGGTIELDQTEERGSRFVVRMPIAKRGSVPSADPSEPPDPGARARVLIIDDDVRVARALARILKRHECVIVESGSAGRDLLTQDSDFDLIFCDVMMPNMSGPELYSWLATFDAELASRTYFVTGGAFGDHGTSLLEEMPSRIIQKPFERETVRALAARHGSRES